MQYWKIVWDCTSRLLCSRQGIYRTAVDYCPSGTYPELVFLSHTCIRGNDSSELKARGQKNCRKIAETTSKQAAARGHRYVQCRFLVHVQPSIDFVAKNGSLDLFQCFMSRDARSFGTGLKKHVKRWKLFNDLPSPAQMEGSSKADTCLQYCLHTKWLGIIPLIFRRTDEKTLIQMKCFD